MPGSLNYFPSFRNRKNDVSRKKSRVGKFEREREREQKKLRTGNEK